MMWCAKDARNIEKPSIMLQGYGIPQYRGSCLNYFIQGVGCHFINISIWFCPCISDINVWVLYRTLITFTGQMAW